MYIATAITILTAFTKDHINGLSPAEMGEFRLSLENCLKVLNRYGETYNKVELDENEKQLIKNDGLIHAIKHLRKRTNISLVEAASIARDFRARVVQHEIDMFGHDFVVKEYAEKNNFSIRDAKLRIKEILSYLKK